MNDLKNKAILYDDDCPMCAWYTGAFVNAGVLEENNRVPWTQMDGAVKQQVDKDRSRNEIALVDKATGETTYGIDSMFILVGSAFPLLKPILKIGVFRFAMRQLYKLITYNRRMMAGKVSSLGEKGCNPDFNLAWRLVYIVLALVVGSFAMLGAGNTFLPDHPAGLELLQIAFTGWGIMGVATLILPFRKRMDYLGNLATLLLIGSAILLPALVIQAIAGQVLPGLTPLAAGIAHTVMIVSHEKRAQQFGIRGFWSTVWIIAFAISLIGWSAV